jgi:lysozyme
MLRTNSRAPARKGLLAAAALLALVAAALGWHAAGAWQPERSRYPVQGVEAASRDGPINWTALKAGGADFVYLEASDGARRDRWFDPALAEARAAGLRVGALHRYDPCRPAAPQTTAFVTLVPRDPALLPPAVDLALDDARCPEPPPRALGGQLAEFLNDIETHAGKPAILKLSDDFEERYGTAARLHRNLWVSGSYLTPDDTVRPWVLWTANARLRSPAADQPLRWVVVRP